MKKRARQRFFSCDGGANDDAVDTTTPAAINAFLLVFRRCQCVVARLTETLVRSICYQKLISVYTARIFVYIFLEEFFMSLIIFPLSVSLFLWRSLMR